MTVPLKSVNSDNIYFLNITNYETIQRLYKEYGVIDKSGFRRGIGFVLVNNKKRVFLAKRIGQNGWQFPQGGLLKGEHPLQAMYRELKEEIGLAPEDIEILASSPYWMSYRLPLHLTRPDSKPLCIGQKQKWFLLKLKSSEDKIRFDITDSPEFDSYRWVAYWYPLKRVIRFKKHMYRQILHEFSTTLFPDRKSPLSYHMNRYVHSQ